LPTWNFDINDALEYVKNRNWVYTGSSSLSLSDFNSLYHKERRQYIDKVNRTKLKQDLIRLQDAVENNQLYFIDKKKYHSAYTYEVGKLIDKVQDLIGVKKRDAVKLFNETTAFFRPHTKDKHILSERCGQKTSKPPVSRRLQKKLDIFNKSKPTILSNLENAVSNIDDLENIDQLFTQPKIPNEMNHKYKEPEPISAHEAFSEPIDYTHSVYANHTARTAILQGKAFYIGYCTYVRISELMRNKLWENTNGFDNVKTLIQGQAIQLYNQNYQNVYAESMMST
jgi:ribosomal protein L22